MHKIIILLLFVFLVSPGQAKTSKDFIFSVKDGKNNYRVQKEKNVLFFEGQGFSRKFEIKKCNEALVNDLLERNRRLKYKNNLLLPEKTSGIHYSSKEDNKNYASTSLYGKFLRDLPEEILRLAIKEKSLCLKK